VHQINRLRLDRRDYNDPIAFLDLYLLGLRVQQLLFREQALTTKLIRRPDRAYRSLCGMMLEAEKILIEGGRDRPGVLRGGRGPEPARTTPHALVATTTSTRVEGRA